jgi:2-C-methyl-D-erythritol 4-phosphate cytidylyltransferase/2-C-methyl-D-erythritol 2,4-cyclodiphosphate synthase
VLRWGGAARVVVAAPPQLAAAVRPHLPPAAPVAWVAGGAERQDSVAAALAALGPGFAGTVLVHDGARPFASPQLFARVAAAAEEPGWDGAAAALAVRDTLHRPDGGVVDRTGLWAAQTPQAFPAEVLRRALAAGVRATDEAALVTACGGRVRFVPGEPGNLKVTYPEDLALAERLCAAEDGGLRVGYGWDVHRLVPGRALVLGGVAIPSERGLLGHSDADVLCHAVMDACLGAAALGDIGTHFPPDDPRFAGADSLQLLRRVAALVAEAGWAVGNVDATVIAEAPRLAPHVPAMRAALAGALGVAPATVSVKATTAEGLGALGAGEGIAAHATASLRPAAPSFDADRARG